MANVSAPDVRRPPGALLPSLMFACMVVAIVSSLGAPLIPTIAATDNVSLTEAQWSLTITLLVASVASPVMGRLGDGPRRREVFLFALTAMTAGGVLAALPLGFGFLVIGRGLQGLGLGLTPLAIATARDVLPSDRMRAGVAMLSTTAVVGVGLGYPVTGLLARAGGLHLAYWFGAAVGATALVIAWRVVPPSPAERREKLDVAGAVLLGAALAALLLRISQGESWGWGSARVTGVLTAAVVVLASCTWWELRAAQPLVALRLLRERAVLTASVTTVLAAVGMYLLISAVTRFVQTPQSTGYGLGGTVVVAGLVLVPFSVTSYLVTRVVPWLVRRTSYELILPLSSVVLLASMVMFSLARADLWEIMVMMAVAGVGVGSIFAVMPGYLMRAIPASETGSAMSFNQILRYIGYSTGSALSAVLLQAHTTPGHAFPSDNGYTIVGLVSCLVWIATAVAAIALPLRRRQPRGAVQLGTDPAAPPVEGGH
jgi:MFS family permease